MKKIVQIAVREFVTTVLTKAFLIGLLVLPAMAAIGILVVPRLIGAHTPTVTGQVAVVDPTGRVTAELRKMLNRPPPVPAALRRAFATRPGTSSIAAALTAGPKLTLLARPADADLGREKAWLASHGDGPAHVALAVIDANAVHARPGETRLGSYALYVPPRQDVRVETAVHRALHDAIVAARIRAQGLDPAAIDRLVDVPRVSSITVSENGERKTVAGLNMIVPFAFMFLLFMGVFGSGQGLLTTTIEEKSSRVVEVLLSAVSPMQLMAGKLFGHMAISLLGMSLYLGVGLAALSSFSLFGLLDPSLIAYLLLFFVLTFLVIGSLMMAIGAAVNELREAQSLMMPMTLVMILPWFFWAPISRDPTSTLSIAASMIPPVNSFAMLLRLTSNAPPPAWQIWLSVAISCLAVVASVWVAAKVFRIGLLMFGRPPSFATLVKWIRDA